MAHLWPACQGARLFPARAYLLPHLLEEHGLAKESTALPAHVLLLLMWLMLVVAVAPFLGAGFVSFTTAEAAEAAIAVMDGFLVGGRKLKVSIKRGAPAAGVAAGGAGPPPAQVMGAAPAPLYPAAG